MSDDAEAPAFGEPWHAEAFATSMALRQANAFSPAEWTETFSREIRVNPQRANEDSETAYYRQLLGALQTLLVEHSMMSAQDIAEAAEHWRRSYLNTPHGMPVTFSRDWQDTPEPERHHHQRVPQRSSRPAAVSEASR